MKHVSDIGLQKSPEAIEARTRWDELKQERSHHEREWEDIGWMIRGQGGHFASANEAKLRQKLALSSVPIIAQNNFSAELYGTLTNPANTWFGLRLEDPELNAWKPAKIWTEAVSRAILASFRPRVSPFYSSAIQLFSDVASFGNGAQYDEVRANERKILDVTLSLAEVVFDIDAFGRVVEVVRKFFLKPRAAVDMFGLDALPPKIAEAAAKGSNDKHAYYHHVKRNMDWQRGKLGPRGKRWLSIYACEEGEAVTRRAGYDEMPFHAPRWSVESGQTYGRGPGAVALPSARVNHRMEEANLRAGQKAADPTLLAPDKRTWQLNGQVRPGKVLYGGVDTRGNQLVRMLDNFSSTGLTMEMQRAKVEQIQEAFQWSMLSVANRTGLNQIESMEIQERMLRMSAPNHGRIQEEYLAPKIARRYSLLLRQGQLPPPPEGMPEGVGLDVEYLSAAALAQKSAEGASVVRILQDVLPLAQIDPRYMERFSPDDVIEVLHEARGVPARILKSRDEAAQDAQARAQQQQMAQMMEMARQGAGALKDAAQAGVLPTADSADPAAQGAPAQ